MNATSASPQSLAIGAALVPCAISVARGRDFGITSSDHDGITDFHETVGVDWHDPVAALHLSAWGAKPTRKDVFFEANYGTAHGSNPRAAALLAQVEVPFAEERRHPQPGGQRHRAPLAAAFATAYKARKEALVGAKALRLAGCKHPGEK